MLRFVSVGALAADVGLLLGRCAAVCAGDVGFLLGFGAHAPSAAVGGGLGGTAEHYPAGDDGVDVVAAPLAEIFSGTGTVASSPLFIVHCSLFIVHIFNGGRGARQ